MRKLTIHLKQHTTRRALLLFVFAVGTGLIAGCDLLGVFASLEDVEFSIVDIRPGTPNPLKYAPGDSLKLRMKNTTSDVLTVNMSCSNLQKATSRGDWERVKTNGGCPEYAKLLSPGGITARTIFLPTDDQVENRRLEAGDYRYVTDVREGGGDPGEEVTVATQSFEIVRR